MASETRTGGCIDSAKRVIRACIFDVDGVLVATDALHYRAWKCVADAEGIPFDAAAGRRLRGISRMDSLEVLLERSPRTYRAEEKAGLADRKNAIYAQSLAQLTPADVLPGARELLTALAGCGVRLAAGSSSRNARAALNRLGLTERFDAIVDGNDVTRTKPDPEIFLRCASQLGVTPSACVVIEDAVAGIEAARRAGMATIGIGDAMTLGEADQVVSSLAMLGTEKILEAGTARIATIAFLRSPFGSERLG